MLTVSHDSSPAGPAPPPSLLAAPHKPTMVAKAAKVNKGGLSNLSWFNLLVIAPKLAGHRANLFEKIADTKALPSGCLTVNDAKEETRPQMDKRFRDTLNMPEALERYTLYT